MKPGRRRFYFILGLLLAPVFFVFLFFESSLFRTVRTDLAAHYLSDILNQPVVVDGDVNVHILPKPVLVASNLRLPSQSIADMDLLTLDNARLALSPGAYLFGGLQLPEIQASGLMLNLLRTEDNKTSWAEKADVKQGDDAPDQSPSQTNLIGFMGARQINFSDMQVVSKDNTTGFLFEFKLEEYLVDQQIESGAPIAKVLFEGIVNGQPVNFHGNFPEESEFRGDGHIGALNFNLTGHSKPEFGKSGFDSTLELVSGDLDDLLKTLRLEGIADGSATASARLLRREGRYSLEDIVANINLANGKIVDLTGHVDDLRYGSNFDITVDLDLIGKNPPPAEAVFIRDIKAETVQMQLVGKKGLVEIKDFSLDTNAFEEDFKNIGPFHVRNLHRTPDGRFAVDEVSISIGPSDAPFVRAVGHVDDLLALKSYSVDGTLDLPAKQFLKTLRPDHAEAFGKIKGTLHIKDDDGKPIIETFVVRSDESELWNGFFEFTSKDILELGGVRIQLGLSSPDTAQLFDALQLDPVDMGPIGVDYTVTYDSETIGMFGDFVAGESLIASSFDLGLVAGTPTLRGTISSEMVSVEDLANAARAAVELGQGQAVEFKNKPDDGTPSSDDPDDFEPLVLPVEEEDDLAEFTPLVLPTGDSGSSNELADSESLALQNDPGDLKLSILTDPEELLRVVDAKVDIDIKSVVGQKAVSSIKSGIEVSGGRARFGPLQLNLGDGSTNIYAEIDAINVPDRVNVTGKTSGWDVGKLFSTLGLEIGAQGILKGQFNLSGQYASLDDFTESMSGTAVVEMGRGKIATSMLELAGLGVLPWLFSKERQSGFALVECVRAPLKIQPGSVAINSAVLETDRVQLVANGTVDFQNDRVSVRGEPRPVGQPLSRSAWPFEIEGSVKDPKVKIAKRSSRRALVPLAMPDQRVPCVADVDQLKE